MPRLALGDLGSTPAPPEGAVAFFFIFAAAFFSSKLTRLIDGSSSSSTSTTLRFSTLPGYASRVFDIGPPSVRAPPAGPTRARKSPNWSVRVRSVGPENQQKLFSNPSGYSPYRHLGTARRCGAVRSEAVVRSQRSWRRALARRPKHHSGLEVDVMSCIRHAAPTGGWITRGEVLICTTDE